MVDHVKETNGLASVKDILSDLLGVGLEVGKVNDRDRFNGHGNVRLCVQVIRTRERKKIVCYKKQVIYTRILILQKAGN